MADDDNNTGAEATPGPVRKKAAKKKAARKKTTKKVAARAADDSEPTPSEAPRPEPAHQQASVAMHDHGGDADEGGISGWLVMWGPLIIVGFLILVFMGDERSVGSIATTPPPPAEPAAPQQAVPAVTATPAVEVTPEQAAADLAEAFKAAGIPLPAPSRGETPGEESAQPDLPPELQDNPWAPGPGSPPVGAVPPPPGYGHPYAGYYPYAGGYPPPGYHPYGAPPPGYYGYGGWGPPPGYGAMPHMPPGYMEQGGMGPGQMGPGQMGPGQMGQGYMGQGRMGPGRMGPGMMGPGAGYGHPMMQGPAPSEEPEGAPPPPASPGN